MSGELKSGMALQLEREQDRHLCAHAAMMDLYESAIWDPVVVHRRLDWIVARVAPVWFLAKQVQKKRDLLTAMAVHIAQHESGR